MKNKRNNHSHKADISEKKVHQPHKILVFLSLFFSFLFLLFACSARWMLATWGKLTMDEVIIQLSTGITGTGGGMAPSLSADHGCHLPASSPERR